MDVSKYLKRIQFSGELAADLATLEKLQYQHLHHVPFENLDVMDGVWIDLDVGKFFEKVVGEHRGGFCYELNGLFHWLLGELGFQSKLVAATIQRPNGSWARADSHATQIVELDQPYLVDVGFGDAQVVPLPLTGEVREDVSGQYRVIPVDDPLYDLQKKKDDLWQTLYRVDATAKDLPDFSLVSEFNQCSEKSHFTQKRIVTMPTADGRITLSGNHLTITRNGEKEKSVLTEDEVSSILADTFGLKSL